MAKAKKKKKSSSASASASAASAKVTKRLRDISQNPLIADIVAASLVAAASALKDTNKARKLAASAGKELEGLAEKGAQRGNALWQLAMDVGRKSAEALAGEDTRPAKSRKAPKSASKAAKPKPKVRKTASAPKGAKSKGGGGKSPKK